MIPQETYISVGTTTGSLPGFANNGFKDIFVASTDAQGNYTIWAQNGTANNDVIGDAIFGSGMFGNPRSSNTYNIC